jgi:hypothetical protein
MVKLNQTDLNSLFLAVPCSVLALFDWLNIVSFYPKLSDMFASRVFLFIAVAVPAIIKLNV